MPSEPESAHEHKETDPVTHLPITVHDYTSVELEQIPPPEPFEESGKHDDDEPTHARMQNESHRGIWEDPGETANKKRIETAMIASASAAAGGLGCISLFWTAGSILGRDVPRLGLLDVIITLSGCVVLSFVAGFAVLQYIKPSIGHPTQRAQFDNDKPKKSKSDDDAPETAAWLNSLLHSLWPIVNPALFTSISDMLEDTMQATLPKLIHGVRVADIGQGSESVRIVGIRWLDAGDAAISRDGLVAEEGDFVNLELSIAYRAKSTGSTGLKDRSGNAHLLMQFWTVGNVMVPVWVELTGVLASMRIRLQLTPNPPFLSVMTLTLLGQPKVTMACTPLTKGFLNVMDVPGLSSWLQSSINAAMEMYIAPQTLTMDLKTLLMGRPKMDTDAVGVIFINVKSAKDFRDSDASKIWAKKEERKGDPYVTIAWGKWGKPVWSTRILNNESEPVWEETTALLVGPAELNAGERLRLKLWDSDRMTADDALGTVEISLQDLMTKDETKNQMAFRQDKLVQDDGSPWPGTLSWDVGFFSKITFKQHHGDDAEEIEHNIQVEAEAKLREAKTPSDAPPNGNSDSSDPNGEIKQQKKEDLKERTDEIVASSPPKKEWPSGILSVRIEQITGLEVEKVKQSGVPDGPEEEEGTDLPSAYCTIIINHQAVYKTRTKLKSNKPFYDAGTERFIRDWQSTTVIISVRDSRIHEKHALLGVVVLPLSTVFKKCSQVTSVFPIIGGIGFGRVHLSLTFRNVQAKLSPELRGWDVGTIDVRPSASASNDLPMDLASFRLVLRTLVGGKGKMLPHLNGGWKEKHDKPIQLAVTKRYSSCLLIQFKKHKRGPDATAAFCTLWFKDIPDNEEIEVKLPVIKNDAHSTFVRARSNATHENIGEVVGTLVLKVKFWPGLSGYHRAIADGGDAHMRDVMEALDCAEDSKEIESQLGDKDEDSSSSGSSSSSSSSDSDEEKEDDGSRGLQDDWSEYKKRKAHLHRKHRGLMQWQGARKVAWAAKGVQDKASTVGDKLKGVVQHHEKDPGIEKEV